MAVVSNFDERLTSTLERYNLIDYFNFLVTSVESGYDKPDIRIYQEALTRAGVAPHDSAHVGDDVIKDYWAAKHAGMDAFLLVDPAAVGSGSATSKPPGVSDDDVIHRLTDLEDIIDRQSVGEMS